MTWQKLTLFLPQHLIESIENQLIEAGSLAVTMESAQEEELFEPPLGTTPLWQQTRISGLFQPDINLQQVLAEIAAAVQPHVIAHYQIENLNDQDWQKVCTDSFQPLCFADRLWVYPSWQQPPDSNLPGVMLDPGLAFGTGAHPTTALCLEWLAQHIKPGQDIIDYGCGSGILAIAAAKLGARQVWAVDNDPQAIEATRENANRNGIPEGQLQTLLADSAHSLVIETVDSVIANILANPLISLAPFLADKVKSGGNIVLSGILINQAQKVTEAYQSWFSLEKPVVQEAWVRLVGLKY